MDTLMEILEDIRPDVDFEEEEKLIDDKILTSFDILSIITEISETYEIKVSPAEIKPANFNSAKALWAMIENLKRGKA